MAKRKRQYDDDDGRVIVKMNVEGMPWYSPGHTHTLSEDQKKEEEGGRENSPDDLTRKEMFWIYFGAMKAGCLVSLIGAGILIVAGLVVFLVFGGIAN